MALCRTLITVFVFVSHIVDASHSYNSFRDTFGLGALQVEHEEYKDRNANFHRRQQEVLDHNARNLSWKMAVNRFSDHSDAELRAMLGYKRVGGRWVGAPSGTSSFIEQHQDHNETIDTSRLASEVDYRTTLQKSAAWVRNQGACGSCWAVAATGALEMHAEKSHGFGQKLSHQQLVDCTPNPRHCGGTGGCDGATAELAFQFAREKGISAEDAYQSSDGSCNTKAPAAFKIGRFVSLPENKGSHLLHALATHGPVVVSADGSGWFSYSSGVFSGCNKDSVVNHAILGVGYGNDPESKKDYWTIRNSWGADWGEKGFIRVERHAQDDAYCGVDNKPKDGVGCDDAPASVPVCGMCGITADSAYPSIKQSRNPVHRTSVRSKVSIGRTARIL